MKKRLYTSLISGILFLSTEFIYEDGAVIGYVFLGTQGINEVQVPLPYIKSFLVDDGQNGLIDFTETISFEYSQQRNEVTFYIEP